MFRHYFTYTAADNGSYPPLLVQTPPQLLTGRVQVGKRGPAPWECILVFNEKTETGKG